MSLKSIIVFILISTLSFHSRSQTILVNGQESDGKLTWADFTGTIDTTSSFDAFTTYRYIPKHDSIYFDGNYAVLVGFDVVLELYTEGTWAKPGKINDELLVHEQGHFNLGILNAREIKKRVSETKFTRANFNTQMKRIQDETSEKYRILILQYDKETNHSKNKEQQQKWNEFFLKSLAQ